MYTYLGKQKNVTAFSDMHISLIELINSCLGNQMYGSPELITFPVTTLVIL